MDIAEERINEFEDKSTEIIQTETQNENRVGEEITTKIKSQNIQELWGGQYQIDIIGVLGREGSEKGSTEIFEDVVAENFSKINIRQQIQEAQWTQM